MYSYIIIILINIIISFGISIFISKKSHEAERSRIQRDLMPIKPPKQAPLKVGTTVMVKWGHKKFEATVLSYTTSGTGWIYWIKNPFNKNMEEWFNSDQILNK